MKTYTQMFRELGISVTHGRQSRKERRQMWKRRNDKPGPIYSKIDLFVQRKGREPTQEELKQLSQCTDFEMWVCNFDTVHNFDI